MTQDIDLTPVFLKQFEKRNIVGRYHVSSLWGIVNGWETPQGYLSPTPKSLVEALKMKRGTLNHLLVGECLKELGWTLETKIEYKYKDIILVGKVDGIKEDEIAEIKTSDKIYPKAKSWQIEQVRCYLSMFEKS